MPRNIELKSQYGDLSRAQTAARTIGAEFTGHLIQRDTYFNCPNGRLKLREIEGKSAELIAYSRHDQPEARGSDYVVAPVADVASLLDALSRALGVRGVVAKRRELWIWRGVRIHLDSVESLGTFVEFEAVLADGEPDAAGHEKLHALCVALEIEAGDIVAGSYVDLLGF